MSHAVNLGLGGDWLPLADRLADRTGAAVVVENDVKAATWGAHVLSGADDLAYLSIGTGLAAGFVLGGALRRGAHGAAGEIGHVPVDPDGRALLVRAARLPGAERRRLRPDRRLAGRRARRRRRRPCSPRPRRGPRAVAVRDRFAARVADAIRMLGLSVDPAAIILGGGVTDLGEPLLAAVTAALRAQAATSPFLAALDLASPGQAAAGPGARRRHRRRHDRGRRMSVPCVRTT